MKRKLHTALLLALTVCVTQPALAQVLARPGENIDVGSKSVRVPAGIKAGDIDTGSGDVVLEPGAGADLIDTGSGSVRLEAGARTGVIDTGSGSVSLGPDAVALDIDVGSGNIDGRGATVRGVVDTGSGNVRFSDGSRIEQLIDTGSGNVWLSNSEVIGNIDTGSGSIELDRSIARRDVVTTSGSVTLRDGARIEGDLVVRKPKCWGLCWSDTPDPVKIVIGAGAEVVGSIRVEHSAELWLDEQARIGAVTGDVKRMSAERPQ